MSVMKAIVQDRYGPPREVLHFRDIDKPVIRDDEVLVRVRAASIHADVWHVVTGRPYVLRLMGTGLRRPKARVPGTDLAGRIESAGKNVTRFQPGDEVFGESHAGIQWRNGGAYAQYAAVPENALALKPDNVTFSQAASVPTSGTIALLNLRAGELIKARQRVLINGAAGNVGSIAVQLAKAHGAHVTGVDCSAKLAMMRSLGADELIDYTQQDFTQGGQRYDLIFDVASTLVLEHCKRVLNPAGIYIRIGHDHFGAVGGPVFGSLPGFFKLLARAPFDPQLPDLNLSAPGKKHYMEILRGLLEMGKLTPVIDRTYPLSEVASAMAYMESGRARGRIIIAPWLNSGEALTDGGPGARQVANGSDASPLAAGGSTPAIDQWFRGGFFRGVMHMNVEGVLAAIVHHAREVIPALADHQFRADESLRELGANSVDRSEIVMMTLESLSLNMPLIEVARAQNLGELASILHDRLQRAARPLHA